MGVKGMVSKLLHIDPTAAEAIKEIAEVYECSESSIMRKALHNYIALYQDLVKKHREWKKRQAMID